MKRIALLAVVAIVAVVWATAGCSMLNQGPAPAGHEMHQTGIESQTSDY